MSSCETHRFRSGITEVMGFARAQPILVWGPGSQEVDIAANSSFFLSCFLACQFLCSTASRFFVPTTILPKRRAAAAVKAGRRCARAANSAFDRPRLDGGEHGARLDGRDEEGAKRSRDGWRDVILDWAVKLNAEDTASPCIRSGARTRYPNLSCTGESKAQKRRDQSTKRV